VQLPVCVSSQARKSAEGIFLPKLTHMMSNRRGGFHGVHITHASKTVKRMRGGWTVQDDSLGRLHSNRFVSRNKAIRLFQHFMKGL
jgi:hypothetical protein